MTNIVTVVQIPELKKQLIIQLSKSEVNIIKISRYAMITAIIGYIFALVLMIFNIYIYDFEVNINVPVTISLQYPTFIQDRINIGMMILIAISTSSIIINVVLTIIVTMILALKFGSIMIYMGDRKMTRNWDHLINASKYSNRYNLYMFGLLIFSLLIISILMSTLSSSSPLAKLCVANIFILIFALISNTCFMLSNLTIGKYDFTPQKLTDLQSHWLAVDN